jgi:signal transduction histidine kinase
VSTLPWTVKESDYATDLRLKQIMLNLGRNSTKFVHSGFIRFRAAVVDGGEVYVEDSGPGIPIEKRGLCLKVPKQLGRIKPRTGIGLSL